eukprot:2838135-Rhodomonas_salina.1
MYWREWLEKALDSLVRPLLPYANAYAYVHLYACTTAYAYVHTQAYAHRRSNAYAYAHKICPRQPHTRPYRRC